MSTAPTLPSGRVVAGHVLLRLLGSGNFGSVYLASPVNSQQRVALKVVGLPQGSSQTSAKTAATTAFLDAAAAARSLNHPDAVAVLGAGVEQGLAWMTMEAVPGGDLSRYARPPRLLPEALVLQVCGRLARVLAHAHRQGLVHRDVKPANVLVHWPTRTVKLGDFGLARVADAAATATGLMLGSPIYMAPELLAGGLPTPGSDLYALGVTLFELLLGRPPFEAASMGELLRQISQQPAPTLQTLRPDLPENLSQLLQGLLAKTAAARPADGDQVADRLASVAAELPSQGAA